MGENLTYIKTADLSTIPWHSLTGPYERGDKFPDWIQAVASPDAQQAEKAAQNIAMNFEHQDTLWHVTPFCMLGLYQKLDQAATAGETEAAMRILRLFYIVYQTIPQDTEMPQPLPRFSDLAQPQYLPPEATVDQEGWDDEDGILEAFYQEMDESLFFSFFYYAWLVLAVAISEQFPRLRALEHEAMTTFLEEFSNEEANVFLTSILTV